MKKVVLGFCAKNFRILREKLQEHWEQVLKKQGKEVEQEFDQYFSIKETWEAEEQEALYLAGFSDAIQLIKRMGLI